MAHSQFTRAVLTPEGQIRVSGYLSQDPYGRPVSLLVTVLLPKELVPQGLVLERSGAATWDEAPPLVAVTRVFQVEPKVPTASQKTAPTEQFKFDEVLKVDIKLSAVQQLEGAPLKLTFFGAATETWGRPLELTQESGPAGATLDPSDPPQQQL